MCPNGEVEIGVDWVWVRSDEDGDLILEEIAPGNDQGRQSWERLTKHRMVNCQGTLAAVVGLISELD